MDPSHVDSSERPTGRFHSGSSIVVCASEGGAEGDRCLVFASHHPDPAGVVWGDGLLNGNRISF